MQVEDYIAAQSESERERIIGQVNAELAKHPECEGCEASFVMMDRTIMLTGPPPRVAACRDTVFMLVVRAMVARHRAELERDG